MGMNITTLLSKSKNFILTQEYINSNPFYVISYKSVHLHSQLKEIRDLIDPDRTMFPKKASFRFRFTSRDVAEKNYTMLVLKWS